MYFINVMWKQRNGSGEIQAGPYAGAALLRLAPPLQACGSGMRSSFSSLKALNVEPLKA
jgi:hypothetical protein